MCEAQPRKGKGREGRRGGGAEGRNKGGRSESFGDNQDEPSGDCPKWLSLQPLTWKLRAPPPTSLEMRPFQAAGLNCGCTRAFQPVWCLPGFTSILNVLAVHGVLGADLGVVLGRQVQVSKSLKNTLSETGKPVPWTPAQDGCWKLDCTAARLRLTPVNHVTAFSRLSSPHTASGSAWLHTVEGMCVHSCVHMCVHVYRSNSPNDREQKCFDMSELWKICFYLMRHLRNGTHI